MSEDSELERLSRDVEREKRQLARLSVRLKLARGGNENMWKAVQLTSKSLEYLDRASDELDIAASEDEDK